jgi:hypothetical protein
MQFDVDGNGSLDLAELKRGTPLSLPAMHPACISAHKHSLPPGVG